MISVQVIKCIVVMMASINLIDSCNGEARLLPVRALNKDHVDGDVTSSPPRSLSKLDDVDSLDGEKKNTDAIKKRKNNARSDNLNGKQCEHSKNGGKKSVDSSTCYGHFSPPKKIKVPISSISLDVSDDDLDNYGCDEDFYAIQWFEKHSNCSQESSTTDSSNGFSSLHGLSIMPNKNGKRVIERFTDYCDDDSVTDAVNINPGQEDSLDDKVVCIECGKSNSRPKKWPYWINCIECKNYYHKECTKFFRKRAKESELAMFICKHCVKTDSNVRNVLTIA